MNVKTCWNSLVIKNLAGQHPWETNLSHVAIFADLSEDQEVEEL